MNSWTTLSPLCLILSKLGYQFLPAKVDIIFLSDYGKEIYQTYVALVKSIFDNLFETAQSIPPEHIDTFAQMLKLFAQNIRDFYKDVNDEYIRIDT